MEQSSDNLAEKVILFSPNMEMAQLALKQYKLDSNDTVICLSFSKHRAYGLSQKFSAYMVNPWKMDPEFRKWINSLYPNAGTLLT